MNDVTVARDINEILRLIQAFQTIDELENNVTVIEHENSYDLKLNSSPAY